MPAVRKSWEQWLWQLPSWVHFFIAFVITSAVLIQRLYLNEMLGERAPFILSTVAVAIAAYVGGLWPGLFASAVSLFFGVLLFVPPVGNMSVAEPSARYTLIMFAGVWTFISIICDRLRSMARSTRILAYDLSAEQGRLDEIISSLTDAYCAINKRGLLVRHNEEFRKLVGEDGEIRGLPVWPRIPKFQDENLAEELQKSLAGHETLDKDLYNAESNRWTNMRSYPTRDGLFVLWRDITDQKEWDQRRERLLADERSARTEAELTSRLKDEFLATLSHELRTPLTAMLGWIELMQSREVENESTREGLIAIGSASQRLASLIEELLDISRINAGKVKLQLEFLNLADQTLEAVEVARSTAKAKEIELNFVSEEDEAFIRGDAPRLHQVISNLIANAMKFTPRGGRVNVRVFSHDSMHAFEVSDTGEGIEPEFLPHIFDRFRQSDASVTRRHGGLGLGLAIVKQLVELHGGTVQAFSEGSGKGATIRVLLPVAVLDMPMPTDRQVEKTQVDLEGVHILLVEDDEGSRIILRKLLETSGARVFEASGGHQGLSILDESRPMIIISDVGMPEMDGYEFVRTLRTRTDIWASTPVIALTAFARPEDKKEALAAGFSAHLAKPVKTNDLLRTVKSVLAEARQVRP